MGQIKTVKNSIKTSQIASYLLIYGRPADPGIGASGANSSARLKKARNQLLLLVADYSTYKLERTEIDVTIPENLSARFKDVETGEVLESIDGKQKFKVSFLDRRVKLFYGRENM